MTLNIRTKNLVVVVLVGWIIEERFIQTTSFFYFINTKSNKFTKQRRTPKFVKNIHYHPNRNDLIQTWCIEHMTIISMTCMINTNIGRTLLGGGHIIVHDERLYSEGPLSPCVFSGASFSAATVVVPPSVGEGEGTTPQSSIGQSGLPVFDAQHAVALLEPGPVTSQLRTHIAPSQIHGCSSQIHSCEATVVPTMKGGASVVWTES